MCYVNVEIILWVPVFSGRNINYGAGPVVCIAGDTKVNHFFGGGRGTVMANAQV